MPADSAFTTSPTQNIRQDTQIPPLLGWRGAVAIISCAAVTFSIVRLPLSTATIMVSVCAIPLLVLAVERGNALLTAGLDEPERAEAPILTVRAKAPTVTFKAKAPTLTVKAPTLPIRRPASPGVPRVGTALQQAPRGSRRVASRVKLESH